MEKIDDYGLSVYTIPPYRALLMKLDDKNYDFTILSGKCIIRSKGINNQLKYKKCKNTYLTDGFRYVTNPNVYIKIYNQSRKKDLIVSRS